MGDDPVFHQCDAGRSATFGGAWTIPCIQWGNNALAISGLIGGNRLEGTPILFFCEAHMAELIEAGLIAEVAVDQHDWQKRGGRK